MTANAPGARRHSPCKASRRQGAPPSATPCERATAYPAKAIGPGILREWPPCTCGADICPDGGQRAEV